jgi:hypothetical protein
MQKTHFYDTTPPLLQKLKTQQNRDTQRWTNRILTHLFIIFTIHFVSLYSHKKGIGGQPNPKQKGGEMSTEGGLPPMTHTTRSGGDHDLRTHPPGETVSIRLWCFRFASSSRVHRQGINQRKSHRDGLLFQAKYNRSIAVTNRERLWNICRNNIYTYCPILFAHTIAHINHINYRHQHNEPQHKHELEHIFIQGKTKTKQFHIICGGFIVHPRYIFAHLYR